MMLCGLLVQPPLVLLDSFVNVNTPNSERVALGFGVLITIVLWSKYPIIFPILQRPKQRLMNQSVHGSTANGLDSVVGGRVGVD